MKKKLLGSFATFLAVMSVATVPAFAADSSDYILLLPKTEGVTYTTDDSHISSEYSNDQYTVLLYKEGESVELTVSGATDFVIKDAMSSDTTDYAASESEGKVTFTMPAEDLSLNVTAVSEEAVAAAREAEATETAETTETTTETSAETTAIPSDIRIIKTKTSVKESADDNATEIFTLTVGDRVRILSEENGWSRVQFINNEGNLAEGSVKTENLLNGDCLYVTKANVNVRAAADENSDKLGKVLNGNEVVVLDNSGTWFKIAYVSGDEVKEAYMSGNFLQQEANAEINELLTK